MKYYIADLQMYNGDFEHTTTIRFALPDSKDPAKAHEKIAADWYTDLQRDELGWWTTCGTVAVNRGRLTEIDQQVFYALASHIICL